MQLSMSYLVYILSKNAREYTKCFVLKKNFNAIIWISPYLFGCLCRPTQSIDKIKATSHFRFYYCFTLYFCFIF